MSIMYPQYITVGSSAGFSVKTLDVTATPTTIGSHPQGLWQASLTSTDVTIQQILGFHVNCGGSTGGQLVLRGLSGSITGINLSGNRITIPNLNFGVIINASTFVPMVHVRKDEIYTGNPHAIAPITLLNGYATEGIEPQTYLTVDYNDDEQKLYFDILSVWPYQSLMQRWSQDSGITGNTDEMYIRLFYTETPYKDY